jgi:membrane protein implicated in regulation of membrane protease activity
MGLLWLASAIAFLVLEVVTLALYAGFLMVGAGAAAIAAFMGANTPIQVIVFVLASGAGIFAARPPLMAYLKRRQGPELLSGAQSMIGEQAMVVDDIAGTHQPGHVRIHGESWLAVSADGTAIPAGSTIRVDALRQTTLVVSLVAKEG